MRKLTRAESFNGTVNLGSQLHLESITKTNNNQVFNVARCLSHLHKLGFCKSVNVKDVVNGDARALAIVRECLYKVQDYSQSDSFHAAAVEMIKTPGRMASKLQPPRATLADASRRGAVSTKVAGTAGASPLRAMAPESRGANVSNNEGQADSLLRFNPTTDVKDKMPTANPTARQPIYPHTSLPGQLPVNRHPFHSPPSGVPPLTRRASSLSQHRFPSTPLSTSPASAALPTISTTSTTFPTPVSQAVVNGIHTTEVQSVSLANYLQPNWVTSANSTTPVQLTRPAQTLPTVVSMPSRWPEVSRSMRFDGTSAISHAGLTYGPPTYSSVSLAQATTMAQTNSPVYKYSESKKSLLLQPTQTSTKPRQVMKKRCKGAADQNATQSTPPSVPRHRGGTTVTSSPPSMTPVCAQPNSTVSADLYRRIARDTSRSNKGGLRYRNPSGDKEDSQRRPMVPGGRNSEPRVLPTHSAASMVLPIVPPHSHDPAYKKAPVSGSFKSCVNTVCGQQNKPTLVTADMLRQSQTSQERHELSVRQHQQIPIALQTSVPQPSRFSGAQRQRLPTKQISLHEISTMTQNQLPPVSGVGGSTPGLYRTPSGSSRPMRLPNSASASSNLAEGQENVYTTDSGIASSVNSKDSQCTTPIDPVGQASPHGTNWSNQAFTNLPETHSRPDGSNLNRQKPNHNHAEIGSDRDPRQYPHEQHGGGAMRAKSIEPAWLLGYQQNIQNGSNNPPSVPPSPRQRSRDVPLSPDLYRRVTRQKARELYCLVKHRDELDNRSNVYAEKSNLSASLTDASQLPPRTECNSQSISCSMGMSGNGGHVETTTRINGNQNCVTDNTTANGDVNQAMTYQCTRRQEEVERTTLSPSHQPVSSALMMMTSASSVSKMNHSTISIGPNQQSITNKMDLPNTQDASKPHDYHLCSEPVTPTRNPATTLTHSQPRSPTRPTQPPHQFQSETPLSPSRVLESQSVDLGHLDPSSNPCDAEQLLSSLSKLTMDAQNTTTSLWDEPGCFSDVESEYAALGLLLPPFTQSSTQPLGVSKLQHDTDSKCPLNENLYELSCLSDTESMFRVLQIPRPSTVMGSFSDRYPSSSCITGGSGTSGKLPVASVAPMMSTSKQIRASNNSIGPACDFSSSHTEKDTMITKPQGSTVEFASDRFPTTVLPSPDDRWPRLRSAQSVSTSLTTEPRQQLGAGQSDLALNSKVFDHIKLPYPKVPQLTTQTGHQCPPKNPVRPSLSNYAIPRQNLLLTSAAGFYGSESTPSTPTAAMTVNMMPSAMSETSHMYEKQTEINPFRDEIEHLRKELRLTNGQLNTMTTQLSTKAHEGDMSEKELKALACKLQHLSALNSIKDSEICELRATVQQLRDNLNKLQSTQEANVIGSNGRRPIQMPPTQGRAHPRPPRSNSCRVVPDSNVNPHDSLDTTSLNSLVSTAGSAGSQDRTVLASSPQGRDESPDASADVEQGVNGKRSRWMRPSLGKAFKKRSKSSLDTGDRDSNSQLHPSRMGSGTNLSTATVYTHPNGARASTPAGPEVERDAQAISTSPDGHDRSCLGSVPADWMTRIRSEMRSLEATNQRLRHLILNSPVLHDPTASVMQSNGNGSRWPLPVIGLSDLFSSTPSGDAVHQIRVYASTDVRESRSMTSASSDSRGFVGQCRFHSIGCISIKSDSTTWYDIDHSLARLTENYCTFVDPQQTLGLSVLSLKAYRITCCRSGFELDPNSVAVTRQRIVGDADAFFTGTSTQFNFSSNPPLENTPMSWIVNHHADGEAMLTAVVLLNDQTSQKSAIEQTALERNHVDDDGSPQGLSPQGLSLLAFDTLIPTAQLQDYLSIVQRNRFIVLCGPTGTGKSKVLQKLVEFLIQCHSDTDLVFHKLSIKSNGVTSMDEIVQFVCNATQTNCSSSGPLRSSRLVVLLEHMHQLTGSVENLVEAIRHNCPSTTVVATSDILNRELQNLHEKRCIGLLDHLANGESTTAFLSSYLRRRLVQTRLSEDVRITQSDEETLTQAVTWIPKVWHYVNRLSTVSLVVGGGDKSRFEGSRPSSFLSLRVFLNFPMAVETSRSWFTDLWNNLILPFVVRARPTTDVCESTYTISPQTDSLDWFLATWPWPRSSSSSTDDQLFPVAQTPTSPCDGDTSHYFETEGQCATVTNSKTTSPPCLVTFGGPHPSPTDALKQRAFENRTSLDSGIVPDGFPNSHSGPLASPSSTIEPRYGAGGLMESPPSLDRLALNPSIPVSNGQHPVGA